MTLGTSDYKVKTTTTPTPTTTAPNPPRRTRRDRQLQLPAVTPRRSLRQMQKGHRGENTNMGAAGVLACVAA